MGIHIVPPLYKQLLTRKVIAYSSASDGYINSKHPLGFDTYNEAWTVAVGKDPPWAGSVYLVIEQYWEDPEKTALYAGYHVNRTYLFFDTSSIPPSTKILSAILSLYGESKYTDTEDTDGLVVQSGQPTYPHDPIEPLDFDKDNYSGNGGSILVTDWAVTARNYITLNSTGIDWINKGGVTKFCLRTKDDVDGTSPGEQTDGIYKGLRVYSREKGVLYAPELILIHTL